MKRISLLPPEIKKSVALKKKRGKVITSIAVLTLLTVLVYSALFVNSLYLRAGLRALSQERETVETQVVAMEVYAALHRDLTAAERLVLKAMGTVPPWTGLIQEIGITIPVGVWLSDVAVKYTDQGGELTLRGWAYNHDDVAAMLERIYAMEQLDDIRCRVSLETFYGDKQVVQFTVNTQLKTGPAFLTPVEGGG